MEADKYRFCSSERYEWFSVLSNAEGRDQVPFNICKRICLLVLRRDRSIIQPDPLLIQMSTSRTYRHRTPWEATPT